MAGIAVFSDRCTGWSSTPSDRFPNASLEKKREINLAQVSIRETNESECATGESGANPAFGGGSHHPLLTLTSPTIPTSTG
jgi:hypothetical protein